MRLLAICLLALMAGCTVSRDITVTARPPGARISIDSVQMQHNPWTGTITWESDTDSHNITAEMGGYKPETIQLRRDDPRTNIQINLKPQTRAFTINVSPVPAIIKINGKPVDGDMHTSYATPPLEVNPDPTSGAWKEYKVTAEREGFKPATVTMRWRDGTSVYNLNLEPVEKEFSVTTTPPGANVSFDDDPLGPSPIEKIVRPFPFDVRTNQYVPHKLKATLPGYPPQERDISYDDGVSDYEITMEPSRKTVHIKSKPPGGIVKLDGKEYQPDANGDASIDLAFPPVPGTNDLKVYTGEIRKPKTADAEWYPRPITIKWDGGQSDYTFPLREVKTTKIPLMSVEIEHSDGGWIIPKTPTIRDTVAGKSVAEPSGAQPVRLTPRAMKNIDALAVSPDGKSLLFSVLEEKPSLQKLVSVMYTMPTDGSAPPTPINDGNSLDLTPSYSPDGEQILYASNRLGNRLIICAMSALGGRAVETYTTGQTTDWWPSMDSSPKPRIFYESRSDTLANPTIATKPIDTVLPTDLSVDGGMRPRINPQNDTVLYERYNEHTRKRDIWRMSDAGANRVNITNSPDDDDYDASWDRIGARIAFASDQGVDEDKNHNDDIWILDMTQPNAQPQQITVNPSVDDHPMWDPSGKSIYFRSNRGGEWGIWKIDVK